MSTRSRPVVQGTPEQRREMRKQVREVNRQQHVRTSAQEAGEDGRRLVVIACNAALAASKRITNEARMTLAREIAQAVQRADAPKNRREGL